MKIKQEHYKLLKEGMKKSLENLKSKGINSKSELIEYYQKNNIGNIPKDRACFDLLNNSIINDNTSTRFICDILYPYMNDNHLKTALNRIMQEL